MKFERRDLDLSELTAILDRSGLSAEERDKLKGALDTLAFLTGDIGTKGASILRLRRMLFGASTEKTGKIFPDPPKSEGTAAASADNEQAGNTDAAGATGKSVP